MSKKNNICIRLSAIAVCGFALSLLLLPSTNVFAATLIDHFTFDTNTTGVNGTAEVSHNQVVIDGASSAFGAGSASTTGDSADIDYGNVFNITSADKSISFWTKMSGNNAFFIGKDDEGNNTASYKIKSDGNIFYCDSNGAFGCNRSVQSSTPTLNTWHMITVTRAANDWRLYFDGALAATSSHTNLDETNTFDLCIFASGATCTAHGTGQRIDELYFFDGILTADEIHNLYIYNALSPTHPIKMDWPINATTSNFSNWTIDDTAVAITTGTYGIQYGTSSNNLDHIDTVQIVNGSGLARVGSTNYLQIPNSLGLNMSKTAIDWYAKPYYFDSATFTFTYGSTVHFTIDTSVIYPNISTLNVSSSIVNLSGPFPGSTKAWFTPSSTDIYGLNCDNTSSSEIGFGVAYSSCKIIDWLFIPSQFSVQTLGDGFLSFQKVPPMSFLFTAINTVSSSIAAAEASSSASTTLISYKGVTASAGPNALRDEFSQQVKDTLWTWQDHALWALAFLGAIGTILKL